MDAALYNFGRESIKQDAIRKQTGISNEIAKLEAKKSSKPSFLVQKQISALQKEQSQVGQEANRKCLKLTMDQIKHENTMKLLDSLQNI